MGDRATIFQSCPFGLTCGRPDISMPFSHRPATQGFSGALRRCTYGGMIVVPLLDVGPSLKVVKKPRVKVSMHSTEEQRSSRQPHASSPNTSLQRTEWHKVLARGRAGVALRPRNRGRVVANTGAETHR
jgi:hypothetical protein